MGRKRKMTAPAKATAKEDRISELRDCIIHRILSFLPSTEQAIHTSILSKRWLNQWIHIPVLIFDEESTDFSPENFLNFVDNTLIRHHNCSNIKKLHLNYPDSIKDDPQFDSKILFATRKHILLNTASSLVKLTAIFATLFPDRKVNWGCLTALTLNDCRLTDHAVQHILSGSPLHELLELIDCCYFYKLVIASKSLKRLVLRQDYPHRFFISAIQISCPNLVELLLTHLDIIGDGVLFTQAIEDALSISSLLESLELVIIKCRGVFHQFVIASKSLKKLVLLSSSYHTFDLVICCPLLEELKLFGCLLSLRTVKLLDLPSSLSATFDFYHDWKLKDDKSLTVKTLVKDILQQLHHIKELTIGSLFIKIVSAFEEADVFSFLLNIKSLTLNSPNLRRCYSGIACLLRNAPELEKLVINRPLYNQAKLKLGDFGENFWNPDAVVFNCLLSHLKTIKIIGFPRKNYKRMFLLSFVQFLLKNAKVLEKMVITSRDRNVPLRISNKLLGLPRCSKYVENVEFLYSRK